MSEQSFSFETLAQPVATALYKLVESMETLELSDPETEDEAMAKLKSVVSAVNPLLSQTVEALKAAEQQLIDGGQAALALCQAQPLRLSLSALVIPSAKLDCLMKLENEVSREEERELKLALENAKIQVVLARGAQIFGILGFGAGLMSRQMSALSDI